MEQPIPTEEINISRVTRRIFTLYADQYSIIIPSAVVIFVMAGAIDAALDKASPGLSVVSVLVTAVGNAILTSIVVLIIENIQAGHDILSPVQLLHAIWPFIWQLVYVGFVVGIFESIGFVLLVVPGLFLVTIWAVFAPVIVLERVTGFHALARSRELVRGNGWRVFAIVFVFVVLIDSAVTAITFADRSSAILLTFVVRVVLDTLAVPISALAATVLYFELISTTEGAVHL
jgi:hypothetical protein